MNSIKHNVYTNVTLQGISGNLYKVNLHNWTHLVITGGGSVILNFLNGPVIEVGTEYYKETLAYAETRVNLKHIFVQRIHGVTLEDHSIASIYEDTFADPVRWEEPNIQLHHNASLKIKLALLEAKRLYRGYTL